MNMNTWNATKVAFSKHLSQTKHSLLVHLDRQKLPLYTVHDLNLISFIPKAHVLTPPRSLCCHLCCMCIILYFKTVSKPAVSASFYYDIFKKTPTQQKLLKKNPQFCSILSCKYNKSRVKHILAQKKAKAMKRECIISDYDISKTEVRKLHPALIFTIQAGSWRTGKDMTEKVMNTTEKNWVL